MKIVNAEGQLCPIPLIMTKKALGEIQENESLKILIDNESSKINVIHYLEDNGMFAQCNKNGDKFEILVSKKGIAYEDVKLDDYCKIPDKLGNYVISFQKNGMGEGTEELSEILLKAFINSLPDANLLPNTLIFLNAGIKLVVKNSPVIKSLKKLEKIGVEMLVCGTCLEYFNETNNLAVGRVSNMYDIMEKFTNASKIIYP